MTEEEIAALQKELEDKNSELEKLRAKDMNFEKLRGGLKKVTEMTEEEKKAWTTKEQVLLAEIQSLRENVEGKSQAEITAAKESALEKLVGKDEKAKEKALFYFDQFKDAPKTAAEVEERMRQAAILANGDAKDPLAIPISMSGNPVDNTPKKKDYSESQDGQDLLAKMGHESPKK